MLSNCGKDENGLYKNGEAGDQTGKEWNIINWYSRPWTHILRHPNADVREWLAKLGEEAAANNNIGYDQNERDTYWRELKKANYRPKNINVKCEADCSTGVASHVKAVGYLLDDEKLKNVLSYIYTGNLRNYLEKAGFEVLTESKYLTSDKYLLRGDILLSEYKHTCTNLTTGSKILPIEGTLSNNTDVYIFKPKNVYMGQINASTLLLQTILKGKGYKGKNGELELDKSCGPETVYAINSYQEARRKDGVEVGTNGRNDGSCGPKMWRDLINL